MSKKPQTITILEIEKATKKGRKTLMNLIKELNIPLIEISPNNNRTPTKAIELKYSKEILLYLYCTELLGRTEEFEEKNLTIRNEFSKCLNFCKKKTKDYNKALNNFADSLDFNLTLNLYLTREIRSLLKSNNHEKKKILNLLEKMTNRIGGIKYEKVAVFDTSFLLHRPNIINEIKKSYEKIIIPKIVIIELNNLKDKKNKDTKNSNLVLSEIQKNINLIIIEESNSTGNNDSKIFDVVKRQKSKIIDVYSDDKDFKIHLNNIPNINIINSTNHDNRESKNNYNYELTRQFISGVEENKIEIVEKLLSENININAFNKKGLTPLMIASINGSIKIVKLLLSQKNVEIDKLDVGKYKVTALGNAVLQAKRNKNTEMMPIIRLLVNSGANINKGGKGRNFNNTPLLIASWNGNYEIVKYFINKKNVSINQVDSNGFSPLIKASINNNHKIIPLLINKKADKNIYSFEDKRAVDYCRENISNLNEGDRKKRAMKILELLND